MRIECESPVSDSRWYGIVEKSADRYFFHTPAWARILRRTYGYEVATRLYRLNGSEILIPMVRAEKWGFEFCNSIPMGYGGIFATHPPSVNDAQAILRDIVRGRCLHLRVLFSPFSDLPCLASVPGVKLLESEYNYTHVLPLGGNFEQIWNKRFRKVVRWSVRKAARSNLTVLSRVSLDNLKECYDLLVKSSKTWGYETAPWPWTLFENIYKLASNAIALKLALKEDKVIAAVMMLNYGRNAFYLEGGFLREYSECCASSFLLSQAIEDACNQGFSNFNFGSSGRLAGVASFKESFGAQRVYLRRYEFASKLGKVAGGALALRKALVTVRR